jgi:hypothetical protein
MIRCPSNSILVLMKKGHELFVVAKCDTYGACAIPGPGGKMVWAFVKGMTTIAQRREYTLRSCINRQTR